MKRFRCKQVCHFVFPGSLLFSPLQPVEVSSLSAAVSHFLCCLLVPHHNPASPGEEPKKRSRRRGRGGGGASDSMAWSVFSGNELWSLIGQDAKVTYGLTEGLGWDIKLAYIIHPLAHNHNMFQHRKGKDTYLFTPVLRFIFSGELLVQTHWILLHNT